MSYDVSPLGSCEDLSGAPASNAIAGGSNVIPLPLATGSSNAITQPEEVFSEGDISSIDEDYLTDHTSATSDHGSSLTDGAGEGSKTFRDYEYPQLQGKTYLDTGGSMIYARSLVDAFSHDLLSNLYGNPHSASTPAALASNRIHTTRMKALRFFNADPEHWDLIFTANATAAIKLVIDCITDYAATSNTPVWYGYHKDAHSSIVGVREHVKMHRCFTSDAMVNNWLQTGGIGGAKARQLGLFAYPGQSNMTGRRLPLSWCGQIRRNIHRSQTYTLLDAAALACTAPLDLSDIAESPDFVALSFYKIFGFPDIGALLVRKASSHVLKARRYFGGGTVDMVITVNDSWHAMKETSLHDRLEDGTLPFLSIFALDHAIDVHQRLYGARPMETISRHTSHLIRVLHNRLSALQHVNGVPLATIYNEPGVVYGDPAQQGATIAFNIHRPDGSMLGYEDVEAEANRRDIYIRSGSLCNPGGLATYLQWAPHEMRAAYASGHRCSNPTQIVDGKPTGVVRVSLGAMNTMRDVDAFIGFISGYVTHQLEDTLSSVSLSTATRATSSLPLLDKRVDSGYGSLASGKRPLSISPSMSASMTLPDVYEDDYGTDSIIVSFIPGSRRASSMFSTTTADLARRKSSRRAPNGADSSTVARSSSVTAASHEDLIAMFPNVPIITQQQSSEAPMPLQTLDETSHSIPSRPLTPKHIVSHSANSSHFANSVSLRTHSYAPLPPTPSSSSSLSMMSSPAPSIITTPSQDPRNIMLQSQAHLLPSRRLRAARYHSSGTLPYGTQYQQQQQQQQQHVQMQSASARPALFHSQSSGPPVTRSAVSASRHECDERGLSALPSAAAGAAYDSRPEQGKKSHRLFGRGGKLRR